MKLKLVLSGILCLLLISELSAQWEDATYFQFTDDEQEQSTGSQSIAVDQKNNIHVMWQEAYPGVGALNYYSQRPTDGGWGETETISSFEDLGYESVLAAQPLSGQAYIAYRRGEPDNSQIVIAERIAKGVWIHGNVPSIGSATNISPSLAVDQAGTLHLVWITKDKDDEFILHYTKRAEDQNEWEAEMLLESNPGPFAENSTPQIKVDSEFNVHITFRVGDFTKQFIRYAYKIAGESNWNYSTVRSINAQDFEHKLYVDNQNKAHVMLGGIATSSNLWRTVYTSFDREELLWSTPKAIMSVGQGAGTSFWVDDQGQAHVILNGLFNSVPSGYIYYATNPSGVWRSERLLGSPTLRYFDGSICMDSENQAYVAAYTGINETEREIIVFGSPSTMTTSLDPYLQAQIQLAPNPTNETITLTWRDRPSSQWTWEIYDLRGKLVSKASTWDSEEQSLIDLQALAPAIYQLKIITKESYSISRIQKLP